MEKFKEKLPLGERPPVRIVGKAPEDVKKYFAEIFRGRFGQDHFEQFTEEKIQEIKSAELPKQSYDHEAIARANEITNNLLLDFGVKPFDIPEENIHIVPTDLYEKLNPSKTGDSGCTDMKKQEILIPLNKNEYPVARIHTILHEMIHLKSHYAEEAFESDSGSSEYRSNSHRIGLMAFSTKKKSETGAGYFEMYRGLNEAVVAELSRRYIGDVLETITDPAVQETIQWQSSEECNKMKEDVAQRKGFPAEDIYFVSPLQNVYSRFSYSDQREVLNYIADFAEESGTVSSREEVMHIFFRAHFTGHLVEIAKLIDKTFGEGTFRNLKYMSDSNSARSVLDDLQKKRRLKKSKKEIK